MPSSDPASSPISLPKGGGSIRGLGEKFQARLFDGTSTWSIPIETSKSRGGFGPELRLDYSSGNGNGLFGLGWSLGFPSVTRKTDKGLPRYADDDVFVLSGAEDLVPVDAGSPLASGQAIRADYTVQAYRPRVESLFACIERWTRTLTSGGVARKDEHWRVVTKDNVTSLYGRSDNARIIDPDNAEHVFQWLLQETSDSKGNHVLYEYAQDDPSQAPADIYEVNRTAPQRYIRRIFYGNLPAGLTLTHLNGSSIGILRQASDPANPATTIARRYALEVVFDYGDWQLPSDLSREQIADGGYRAASDEAEIFGTGSGAVAAPTRPDAFSSYRAGFEVRTRRLCRRILMYHHFQGMTNPLPVRATCFAHRPAAYSQLALLESVTVAGFRRETTGARTRLVQRTLPAVTLEYSAFRPLEQRFATISARDNQLPPASLDNPEFALVDLFGDGMPAVLHAGEQGYRYWRNLGDGRLDLPQMMTTVPADLSLATPGVSLGDTDGDGRVELVVDAGPLQGYFETSPDGGWDTFHAFPTQPTIDRTDPNLRHVDLTGDGLPDMLVTRDDFFLWYQNLGDDGYSEQPAVARIRDESLFPDVFFNDPSGRIRLADMTGDGLLDIVRIHWGTVEYWPNLGYGRFGKRIVMGALPDAPELDTLFDPRRLFLVDLDGTGCADLVYVRADQVAFWFNQSGNTWSERHVVSGTPFTPTAAGLDFADIFGTGTATLVWSRNLGAIPGGNYFALDFCGGVKPYLLVVVDNGLGAITRTTYVPSTLFALDDAAAGTPWCTALPFPVHVVAKVETIDLVSRCRHTTSYTYHHGFFDGHEREFRGFGRVEQLDTEVFGDFALGSVDGNAPLNVDQALHAPPTLTKTWFHTGAWIEADTLAAKFRSEFWAGDPAALALAEHDVPDDREAFRALRGRPLRSEIYALDADPENATNSKADLPFTVTENRYRVRQLQPQGSHPHGVFFASQSERIVHHYERNPADPRITHDLSGPPDAFGNITDTISVGYPRRAADAEVPEQGEAKIAFTKSDYIHRTDATAWLVGIAAQQRVFELTGVAASGAGGKFALADFAPLIADLATPFASGSWRAFHQTPLPSAPSKRLIEWARTYFRKDAAATDADLGRTLAGRLPLGAIDPLALPYETLRAAFTKGFGDQIYAARVDDATLTRAGYVTEADVPDHWWLPSARSAFDPAQFFLPAQTVDPFGTVTAMSYDAYALLLERSLDVLGNATLATNDYRVLQPDEITSANGHVADVAFDALGRVVASAVRSRTGEGDTLAGLVRDLTAAQIRAFLIDPQSVAPNLLKRATARVVYDLGAAPAFHATIARIQHASTPNLPSAASGGGSGQLLTFAYFDGFGREAQRKISAELDAGGAPRWVGSGWIIYDNKGKPVRQFEPFFTATHAFEFNLRQGVSPYLFYDPLGRVVATLRPDHSWEKVLFDPWQQTTYDANDTALVADPRNDPDVGGFFALLPQPEWSLTWYAARIGASDAAERDAAQKVAAHAGTPTVVRLDALARPVLAIGDLGGGKKLKTRTSYDIQGNVLTITDPRGIVAFTYRFDMAKRRLAVQSADAGTSRLLPDALDAPMLRWDAKDQRVLALFDALHRPTERWRLKPGERNYRLTQKTIYGESAGSAAPAGSLRGQAWKVFDGVGLVRNEQFDFKANLVRATRVLWADAATQPEWGTAADPFAHVFDEAAAMALLDPAHTYAAVKSFDALNRVVTATTPDGSVQEFIFNATNLLDSITLRHRGSTVAQTIVGHIDYNAKGQRTRIEYGNEVATDYTYDGRTFRLQALTTNRASGGNPLLQDLSYAYDAVGNITTVRDGAHQTVYFAGQAVDPESRYKYDSLYRLIEGTGREHVALGPCYYQQGGKQEAEYIATGANGQPVSNAQALANYTQRYIYDDGGNLTEIRVLRNGTTRWVRTQTYESASNRIKRSEAGCQGEGVDLSHDANGNLLKLAHLPQLDWNDRNQLIGIQLNLAAANPDRACCHYDAAGQRVRKTIIRGNRVEERIYLGPFELFVVRNGSGVTERWESLHVADGEKRIALIETRTDPANAGLMLDKLTRFQFDNHLGSAVLEIDDSSAARIISYEEYAPYGETTYIAGQQLSEVRRKRYRFSGKERDTESGLYYFSARYFAPWMGRWLNCDPIGIRGGLNAFVYAKCAPITHVDPTGLAPAAPGIPPAGLEVADLAEGLSTLDRLADYVNATKSTHEYFLGEQGGTYRIFELVSGGGGSPGGSFPPGYAAIGHTHPRGAYITNEDFASIEASGVLRGSMRSHVIATGNGRFNVIEITGGRGQVTLLNLTSNEFVEWAELAKPGTQVNPPLTGSPITRVGSRAGVTSSIQSMEDLAGVLRSPQPVQDIIRVSLGPSGNPVAISRSLVPESMTSGGITASGIAGGIIGGAFSFLGGYQLGTGLVEGGASGANKAAISGTNLLVTLGGGKLAEAGVIVAGGGGAALTLTGAAMGGSLFLLEQTVDTAISGGKKFPVEVAQSYYGDLLANHLLE
jgi:RHS repeat-associated protein